jgi:PncC family amidohydrolase
MVAPVEMECVLSKVPSYLPPGNLNSPLFVRPFGMALDNEISGLSQVFWELATSRGLSVSTFESCTGGLLAGALTELSGSSRYFRGGVVAYDNAIKTDFIGVDPTRLSAHGAVSKDTVEQMAESGRKLFRTNLAIAVSGVAGPTGGTKEKPVGTVWLACSAALAGRTSLVTRQFLFSGNRFEVRQAAVCESLRLLIECGKEVSCA